MFFKRYTEQSDVPEWGGATYYFETDSSSRPIKEVAVYQNGNRRGYDREHPRDEYGSLPEEPLYADTASQAEWHQYRIHEAEFLTMWSGESISTEDFQKAVKSVHSTGTWAIVLGVLNIIVTPLLGLLVTPANGQTKTSLVVTTFIIGLVIGGIYIGLGLKLKQMNANTLLQAKNILIILAVLVIVIGIITLIQNGHGLGILNYALLFSLTRATSNIQKLKKDGLL